MGAGDRRLAELADFVERVVRASSVVDLEQRYLDGIGQFVPGAASGMYLHDSVTGRPESFSARGVSDYYMSRYERLGRERDPVLAEALDRRHAVHNLDLMSPREWTALPVYRDVFHLHGMVNVLIAPIVVEGVTCGTLNFARTEDQTPFSAGERDTADTLGRLFAVALPVARASITAHRDRDRLLEALDLSGAAVVITDTTNASRTTNPAATRILDRIEGGEMRFEELLAACEEGGRAGAPVTLTDGQHGTLDVSVVLLNSDAAVTTAFLRLSVPGEDRLPPAVEQLLSERERTVAALAAAGLHDTEIADQLFVSAYTVKQHLKSAYAKLNIRSRVELARLMTTPPHPPRG